MRTLPTYPPIKGLDRRLAHSTSRPRTTPDCRNIRAADQVEERLRCGQRSGLRRMYESPPIGASEGEVIPEVFHATDPPLAVSTWGSSTYPAGTYAVVYKEGAYRRHASNYEWEMGGFHVYSHSTDAATFSCESDFFATQAAVEAAHLYDTRYFSHTSGNIGIGLIDDPVNDNVQGSPNPTFELIKVANSGGTPLGAPVRMLAQVRTTRSSGDYTGIQDFPTADLADTTEAQGLGAPWVDAVTAYPSGPGWLEETRKFRQSLQIHNRKIGAPEGTRRANVWKPIDISTSYPYTVEYSLVTNWRRHFPKEAFIFLRMDDDTPNPYQDGVVLMLTRTLSSVSGYKYRWTPTFTRYASAASTPIAATLAYVDTTDAREPITFRATVHNNMLTVWMMDGDQEPQLLLNGATLSSPAGTRVGVGLYMLPGAQRGWAFLKDFEIRGTLVEGDPTQQRTVLVASAGGKVYEENSSGNRLDVVSGNSAEVSSDHSIMAAEQGGTLYIADYDATVLTGTDGIVSSNGAGAFTVLASSTVGTGWLSQGLDVDNHVCIISGTTGSSSPTDGTYGIASIASTAVTLSTDLVHPGSCDFEFIVAAKVYQHGSGVSIWNATTGDVPDSCRLICLYRDRIVLAGSADDPHNWFMSRQGDPLDFDYGQTDVQAAVAGNTADAGKVGQPVTALIPYSDDYLIFGCRNSMWLCRGDPAAGGSIDNMTYKTGVLDKFAWCHGPSARVFFLGTDGMYVVSIAGGEPENISHNRIPRELANVDISKKEVALAWDNRQKGVMIFVTESGVDDATGDHAQSTHWFFDPQVGGFFPDSYANAAFDPTCVCDYDSDRVDTRRLLMGGRDGFIRAYYPDATTDDGETIDSYFLSAPQSVAGRRGVDGCVIQIDATLPEFSDPVAFEIRVGNAAEAAVAASASISGTYRERGMQRPVRSRARGHFMCWRLGNNTLGETWGVERLSATATVRGKRRF